MAAWNKQNPERYKRNQVVLAILLGLLLIIAAFAAWLAYSEVTEEVPVDETAIIPQSSAVEQVVEEPAVPEPEPIIEEAPAFDATALQTALDAWDASVGSQASVVIADVDGTVLASIDPDRVYFAASIYKLYVAYAGYQQVDAGLVDPSESYINGNTRLECLDLMIRESDSPCAEKMWVEFGRQTLTDQLEGYGLSNTDMTNIRTPAADAAIMLGRIARSQELSIQSQQRYLESMRTQIYRDALNAGFSDTITVYNKIGFNEIQEYHDTAIVQLPNGEQLIVSVLTDGVGTRNIAQLARDLEAILLPAQ